MPILPSTIPPEATSWKPEKGQHVNFRFSTEGNANEVPDDLDLFTDFLGHEGIITEVKDFPSRIKNQPKETYVLVAFKLPKDAEPRCVQMHKSRFVEVIPTPAVEKALKKFLKMFETQPVVAEPPANAHPA